MYGARMVYGVCILGGGIAALISPVMARWHYGALIALRIIHGMFQGVSWPYMHACITRWILPIERPRFVAIVYLAATLSSAMIMPLCGVIIDNHGWASQFYVMGALSLLWCCVWFNFMHNSPEEHPRISVRELQCIRTALKESGTKSSASRRVPWKEIFSSLPVWAIFAGCTGNGWGISLLFAQLPTYMKNVLGFSIRNESMEAWQRVFWICVPIHFITAIFYLFLVTGEIQPWNDVEFVKVSPSSSSSTSSPKTKTRRC
ncbi:sialin-like isoform X2 [Macrobrachium nipponense]|uniref:sialin-like isoform X2 n=1 Tax=Macrobrachium nipponense TaxID=159736 RepID=UPI0030C7E875